MRYFLDITPTVFDPVGAPHVLGTVRYQVDDALLGEIPMHGPIRYGPNPPVSLSSPMGGAPARVMFETVISPADAPQPSPITTNGMPS